MISKKQFFREFAVTLSGQLCTQVLAETSGGSLGECLHNLKQQHLRYVFNLVFLIHFFLGNIRSKMIVTYDSLLDFS